MGEATTTMIDICTTRCDINKVDIGRKDWHMLNANQKHVFDTVVEHLNYILEATRELKM